MCEPNAGTAGSPRLGSRLAVVLCAAGLGLASALGAQPSGIDLRLESVAEGLVSPLAITHAGDGSGRLFLAEQGGTVRIHDGAALLAEPFLDISGLISTGGERGLLDLAFHPDFAANGALFVYYTRSNGNSVLARYRRSAADPSRADPGSGEILLTIGQPFSNHNGGHLAFGPDGFLYIATGDGGAAGDPGDRAQSLGNLLGKVLRIDVDRTEPGRAYAVPPSNPLLAQPGARGEIWAYGLRNPWRFSFDRATGDLFIADVGQNRIEEVNLQRAGSSGGENYGWRRMEGSECFDPPSGCQDPTLVLPILEYTHAIGVSITGGFVYRGSASPSLEGVYVFGDFGSGRIWGAVPEIGGEWRFAELLASGLAISTFGEDEAGELYLADYAGGGIHRLVAESAAGCELPLGHPSYCELCGPCQDGQGDCDGSAECAPGTACARNVGADFGFTSGTDVCLTVETGGCPLPAGHPRFCRDCGPCGAGEGDCDGDSQCAPGTACVNNVGADFGFSVGTDVCLPAGGGTCPLPAGHPRFCRDCGPCGAGEGDCDGDSECTAGTRCASNVGADFGFSANIDVCVSP